MSEGFVYFIKENDTGNVKIGFTSQHPNNRLNELQTGNSSDLSLIGYVEGDKNLEKELHNIFWQDRTRESGEWFKMSNALKENIQSLLKKQLDNINRKISESNYSNLHLNKNNFSKNEEIIETLESKYENEIYYKTQNIDNIDVINFEVALLSERLKLIIKFIKYAENEFNYNYKHEYTGKHPINCAYNLNYLNKKDTFVVNSWGTEINFTPIPGVNLTNINQRSKIDQRPKWDNSDWITILDKRITNENVIELFLKHEEWYLEQFRKHKEYHKTFLQKIFR